MNALLDSIANAPSLWTAVGAAVIGVLVTLNLPISTAQATAGNALIVAVVALLQGIITHRVTTPNAQVAAAVKLAAAPDSAPGTGQGA